MAAAEEEAPTGGPRPSALEEYKKHIEETRRQLETSRALGRESEAGASSSAVPQAPAAPPRTTAEASTRRPSFSAPAPPPARGPSAAAPSASGRNPNPSRTPRPSFRRSSLRPSGPPPSAPSPRPAEPQGEKRSNLGVKVEPAGPPEASPRTKAKELIGQTLENLRQRAKPFGAGKPDRGGGQTRESRPAASRQTIRAQPASASASASPAGAVVGGGGDHGSELRRLLRDANLAHKKVDALVERDQNVKSGGKRGGGARDGAGADAKLVDRLYDSVSKLRQLERSRNQMALCAETMESSVRDLNRFADRVAEERRREASRREDAKRGASQVIRTNGSMLQAEIALALRASDADQRQVELVKSSIRDFLAVSAPQQPPVSPSSPSLTTTANPFFSLSLPQNTAGVHNNKGSLSV